MDSNSPSTTLYDALSEQKPELMATLTPEVKQTIHDFDEARAGLHEAIENRGKRPTPPQPAFQDPNIRNIRQANRKVSSNPGAPAKGKKRTKSVAETYAGLEKDGLVRIVRKKGRAPKIIFLNA